jgi:hypothetical protein
MELTDLERLAKRVATVYNGKAFPRWAQIEAMHNLQEAFKRREHELLEYANRVRVSPEQT